MQSDFYIRYTSETATDAKRMASNLELLKRRECEPVLAIEIRQSMKNYALPFALSKSQDLTPSAFVYRFVLENKLKGIQYHFIRFPFKHLSESGAIP